MTCARLLDGRAQARCGDRQDEVDARPALGEPGGRREERLREMTDLAAATARQHGHQWHAVRHAERRAGRGAVDLRRDRLGQGMSDERRRHRVGVVARFGSGQLPLLHLPQHFR